MQLLSSHTREAVSVWGDTQDFSSSVLGNTRGSWDNLGTPISLRRRIPRAPWRFIPNPSHAPIRLLKAALCPLSVQQVLNTSCACISSFPLDRVEGQICLWTQILNFRPICDLYWPVMLRTWKVLCLMRKWTLFLFHLDHTSLTKNLSKAKNFKNHCYEWSENLLSKEVPKRSVLIADLFVSFNFLLQQWGSFHTHTKRSFVFPSMCEFCGILSGYRKAYLYFQHLACQQQLLWKHPLL